MSVLTAGMTFQQAAEAVTNAAIAQRGDGDVGVWTETGKEKVLVGLAPRGRPAFTVEIDRAEFDGVKLLAILGIEVPAPRAPEPPPPVKRPARRRQERATT